MSKLVLIILFAFIGLVAESQINIFKIEYGACHSTGYQLTDLYVNRMYIIINDTTLSMNYTSAED